MRIGNYQIPDIIYEAKGGANQTLEWSPLISEAEAAYLKANRCSLYMLTTATGVKTLVKRK